MKKPQQIPVVRTVLAFLSSRVSAIPSMTASFVLGSGTLMLVISAFNNLNFTPSVIRSTAFATAIFGALTSSTHAEEVRKAEDAPPTAEEVMRLVRLSYALQDHKLTGSLRDDDSGKSEPFALTMTQQIIRFRFENPAQIVHLDLTTSPPTLRETKPGASGDVPMDRYSELVRGFQLNYEDLSMRFIEWPNPKILGEDSVGGGQKAWKVRVVTPDGKGPYGTVDMWVHQGSGGMAKMEGWDKQGNLVKRFQIRSVQKVGDAYIPKEMRIETFEENGKKTVGRTYMRFEKPEKN